MKVFEILFALLIAPTLARAAALESGREGFTPIALEILPAMSVNELGTVPNSFQVTESNGEKRKATESLSPRQFVSRGPDPRESLAALQRIRKRRFLAYTRSDSGLRRNDEHKKGRTASHPQVASRQLQKLSALPNLSAGNVFDGGRALANLSPAVLNHGPSITSSPLKGLGAVIKMEDFSPDASKIAVTDYSGDGTVKIFSTKTGDVLKILGGHANYVGGAVFSSDGSKIAVAGQDGKVNIWDANSWELLTKIERRWHQVFSMAFNGSKLAIAIGSGAVEVLDALTGDVLETIAAPGPSSGLMAHVNFSDDGRKLAVVYSEGHISGDRIKIFDAATWNLIGETKASVYKRLVFNHDASTFAIAAKDLAVEIYSVKTFELLKRIEGCNANNVVFSHDDSMLAASCGGAVGRIEVWNTKTWEGVKTFAGHKGYADSVAFSPDDSLIFSTGQDRTVMVESVSDTRTGRIAEELSRREIVSEEKSENSSSKKEKSAEDIFRIWPDFSASARERQ